MSDQLFGTLIRQFETGRYSRSSYDYLRTNGDENSRMYREMLESWFSKIPTKNKADIKGRFRSQIEVQHHSAFFELLLHNLSLSHGYSLEIHPKLNGTLRSPDFLVRTNEAVEFYLETAVVSYRSQKEVAATARQEQLYDQLNKLIVSEDFFIGIDHDYPPHIPIPTKPIADMISKEIAKLDADVISKQLKSKSAEAPSIWIETNGWKARFFFFPKSKKNRGASSRGPLAMFSRGFHKVDYRSALKLTLQNKAIAYGSLEKPYIVAVNALEPIDDIDITEALFGQESFLIEFTDSPPEKVEFQRKRNGIWTSSSGPTHNHVSAIIIGNNLRAWNLENNVLRVYHNPWAKNPIPNIYHRLPYANQLNGKYIQFEGETPLSIVDRGN
jgi:hypothetical protein